MRSFNNDDVESASREGNLETRNTGVDVFDQPGIMDEGDQVVPFRQDEAGSSQ